MVGRDALSNTSCECVVAKANEAECSANAEVQTREERGKVVFRVLNDSPMCLLRLRLTAGFPRYARNDGKGGVPTPDYDERRYTRDTLVEEE